MTIIKEYRIPLPLSIDEYKRGQLYMVAKFTRENSSKGDWVDIIENAPFSDERGTGQYTYKIIHIDSKIPAWLRTILPSSALEVHEKSWNAYPYSKTEYSCPFLGDRFKMSVETRYLPDNGSTDNALDLPKDQLKNREVVNVEIIDPIDPTKYKPEEDPTLFVSSKTGRGALKAGWNTTHEPVMCCYKVCNVEFRYWGLQGKVENFVHTTALLETFLVSHRQVFCWIDEWFEMTIEDIRAYEEETKVTMEKIRASNEDGKSKSSSSSSK